MILVSEADEVWLDTGPLCRFCEASQLDELASFLGVKARWVRDVRREVDWRANKEPSREHAGLSRLHTVNFPHDRKGASTSEEVRASILQLQERMSSPDDGKLNHLGEIATVLHAADIGAPLVIVDDADGRNLARLRNVPCVTTRQLAVEMHLEGGLSEDKAFEVYRRVKLRSPEPRPTKHQWAADLEEIRTFAATKST